jgi:GNAT superfamily N-acetyltransferase
VQLRIATPADQDSIASLIARVFHEYSERICLDAVDCDLVNLESHYFDKGGVFWVLEESGHVLGTSAVVPDDSTRGVCWLKRLYLDSSLRGTNWGRTLMQLAVDWAEEREFSRMVFWSDVRFERAHRFYEKHGCERTGEVRTMDDSYVPYQEYFFTLPLSAKIST